MPERDDGQHELPFRCALALGLTCAAGALLSWVVGAGSPGHRATLQAVLVLGTLAAGFLLVAWLVLQQGERGRDAASRSSAETER